MCLKRFSGLVSCFAFLLLAVSLVGLGAADPSTVLFEGSIKPVPAEEPSGPPSPHRPHISRHTLKPAETDSAFDFEVVLKMRNFSDLQKRVSRGGRVPRNEMSANHYPVTTDYQRVVDWLLGQGFQITRKDGSRLAVFARGTVKQIQRSLHVDFARVSMEGVEYTSAVTAPQLPASLAPFLIGVNGLQPHLHAHKHLVKSQGVRPNSLTDTNPPYLPSQIAQAYHAQGLYASNITGTGQTIAIVIDTFPLESDLTTFWQTYNVNQSLSNIQFIQVVPGTLPPQEGEESLDVEWSSSIAPGAKVRVYATTDLFSNHLDEAYGQIFDDVTAHPEMGIHQLSLSYGLGEKYSSSSQVSADAQYFANLASAGVTVFVSSGDGGSTPGMLFNTDNTGPTQVESPASDPSVTSVGGTSLTLDASGNPSSESGWNLGGGGTSIYFNRPSWQTGSGLTPGMRAVPDVASAADPGTGAFVTLNGATNVFGGTSWSAPTWAAFCALINQSRANVNLPPVGLLGPKIYPLLGTANFRDITTGNNGFSAGPGFDLVTGLGVPDVQNLAQALIGVQTTPPAATVAPGQNVTFTVATTGTPTGYQWQRMPFGNAQWNNLTDDSTYAGSTTATLTITAATTAMSGDQFQCIVNTGTQMITSAPPSVLVVDTPLVVTTLAGQVEVIGAQDGTGAGAQFNYPSGVAVDTFGNLFIADFNSDTIRKVTPTGVVTTPYGQAGVVGSSNGTGNNALFNTPNSVAADSANNLYVADSTNSTVRKITPDGVVTTPAGRAGQTGTADNPNGHQARFNNPQGIAVDTAGNIFVADTFNYTVRKVTPSGAVTTIAGTPGVNGYADGPAGSALFNAPFSVAVDSQGNVYVADLFNLVVRKISTTGQVTTPYGQAGVPGRLDGIGTGALFNAPIGVAVDGSDNLYVTDSQVPPDISSRSTGNNLLRKITPAGVVSTIAGAAGVSGSASGSGQAAQFYSLQAVTITHAGVVCLADTFNQTVRVGAIAPIFTLQPAAASILEGQSTVFSTAIAGVLAPSYQWQRFPAGGSAWSNLTDVAGIYSGTAAPVFTVSNATLAMNGDQFQCLVGDGVTTVATTNAVNLGVQTGYARWAGGFFTPQQMANADVSGPAATPFNDGISNVLKYLCGIDPSVALTAAGYAALPVAGVETDSGTQYLTLTYRQNQTIAGLTIAVQTSADLIQWQTVTPDSTQTIGTDAATGDPIIQIKVQTSSATYLFIRLQVTSS